MVMNNNIRTNKLRVASKEYLNSTHKPSDINDTLPLVEFKYKGVGRSIASIGFSIVSFVIPDGCIGLMIGREIKNPVPIKARYGVMWRNSKKMGFGMCILVGCHSVRVASSKKIRKIKKIVLRRQYL